MGNNRDQNLFTVAMKGEWTKVLSICREDVGALKQEITKSGATVLHVAVTESQVKKVKELVDLIVTKSQDVEEEEEKKQVLALLRVQNESGYTALHLAASMGHVIMCESIAKADNTLVGVRNNNGETPLFLAALRGKHDAFLYLHSLCGAKLGYSYSRRKDGDTFLHCAIAGGYMGLAFKIIEKYKELVDSVNENGHTPLHVLATKPAAFASGHYHDLGPFRRFVYDHCIYAKQLEIPDDDTFEGKDGTTKSNSSQKGKDSNDPENPNTPKREYVSGRKNPAASGSHKRQDILSQIWHLIGHSVECMVRTGTKYTMVKSFIDDMRELKMKHRWSTEIMGKLMESASIYEHVDPAGPNRVQQKESLDEDQENPIKVIIKAAEEEEKKGQKELLPSRGIVTSETAILVAAKNGITEIVDSILRQYPVAINDRDASKKNIVMLAAENRHLNLFNFLKEKNVLRESIVRKTDYDRNSALHLAAVHAKDKPWPIPGPATQMQWEIKWFENVKSSMPPISFRRNKKGKTPEEIFTETHEELMIQGAKWLVKTSESCSVVAALIAAVAFATSASIPGGVDESSGKPKLEKETAFEVFAISSLIALCFSITSLTMFLAILTSRFQERDFAKDLPRKLLVGLTSLFISIGAMLVSFSSGHSLVTEDKLRYAVFPVYAVACLPVSIFAVAQFPLYFDLILANFQNRFAYREYQY